MSHAVPPAPSTKKAGAGKWVLRIIAALIILIIIALIILYFSIDGIIKSKVEAAAANSTGQTTTLSSANLQLSGILTLSNLDIHNPTGYKSADFVAVPKTVITVKPSSLLSDTVIIPDITIDGLTLSLEQDGLKSNLTDILAYTQKQSAAASSTAAGSGEAGKSKQLDIGKLSLTNVKVTASGLGVGQTFDLGTIEMDHPTDPNGRLPKIADLTAKILERIAQQLAANPQLPDALRKNLGNLNQIIPQAQDLLKNPAGAATQLKGIGDLLKKNK
ncbi:MAG TPA: AsmA family protein [Phycisphaerae bacterium]|nr:AsmA family protein [Phycisphaerae bacterium]